MAGIDPNIILGIKPAQVQQVDPMDRYSKSLALKNLMQQGDLQGIQAQAAQRGLEDENAVRDAYRQAGGDSARLRALLQGGGQYKQLQALDAADLARREKEAIIRKNTLGADKDENEIKIKDAERAASILDVAQKDPAAYPTVRRLLSIQYPQLYARLPEQYDPQAVSAEISNGLTFVQKLTDQRAREQQAETGRHNLATEGNTVRGQDLTARVAREGQGVTMRGQNMTDARARDLAQATRDAAASGKIPQGYRQLPNGNLEAIPGGPHDTKIGDKAVESKKSLEAYAAARDGLLEGLEGSETGVLAGRLPAATAAQQIAQGGVAAMAPVLKSIFRVAGEGTFTDKDQELLMAMVPTRTDSPEARRVKIANIDSIISAKMGIPVPERRVKQAATGKIGGGDVRAEADAILSGGRDGNR